jgi:hypothetical protein
MHARSFAKNRLSLGPFNRIHQRTTSFKALGIPLIPYKGSLPSDLDLFSVSENEPELDDEPGGGTFDDPNIFEIIDMDATQDPTSSTLPPPVVQNRFLQYPIGRKRRDGEDGASFMTRLKTHMLAEVDGEQSTAPLTAYCFMTGFMYVDCTLHLLRISLFFFHQRFGHILCYICLVRFPNGKQCTSTSTSTVAEDLPN